MGELIKKHKIFLVIFLFGLLLRLWHITNPLLDEHHWRQTGSSIIARNYTRNLNFFKPEHDLLYEYETAYGLYEYIVGVLGRIFGFSDILGRLVSLFIHLLGFFYLYKLLERIWGMRTALWASAFYSFLPVSVFYSRSFQPDASMASLTIIFMYYFSLWVEEKKWRYFLLSIVCAELAFLTKIPSFFVFIPAALYWFLYDRYKLAVDWRWYAFILITISIPLFYHWYVPVATDGEFFSAISSRQNKYSSFAVLLSPGFWWNRFFIDISEYQFTHAGYIFLILGIFKKVEDKRQWLFYYWLLGFVVFSLVAAVGMTHEYYWIPFIPVGCAFIGRFLGGFYSDYKARWQKSNTGKFLVILVSLMVLYSIVFSLIRIKDRYKVKLNYLEIAEIIRQNSSRDESILVFDKGETEVIYYANRKGYHVRIIPELKAKLEEKDKYSLLAVTDFDLKTEYPDFYLELVDKSRVICDGEYGLVVKLR
ncbi:MAG: glycosyltransferase family 39 protein [Endomicrobiales bacterium]|nr:glycosyltransferase family 39 protein [Endomicrobiales bacterium]